MFRKRSLEQDFDALVDLLYEAPLDPSAFGRFVAALRQTLGAVYVSFGIVRNACQADLPWFDGLCRTDIEMYLREYAPADPWVHAIQRLPAGWCDAGVKLFAPNPNQLKRSRAYAEFYVPRDMANGLGAVISRGQTDAVLAASIHRPKDLGLPRERELIRRLSPHLQRTVQLSDRMGQLNLERCLLEDALNSASLGVVILDSSNRIMRANQVAEHILRCDDGLTVRDRVLTPSAPAATNGLHAWLAEVRQRTTAGLAPFAVRSSRTGPLVLTAVPIRALCGPSATDVLILLHDARSVHVLSAELLRATLGLTPAEARLATSLAQGQSLQDYAERAMVSTHTARSQLRKVLAKVGVSTQAALVRYLLRLC